MKRRTFFAASTATVLATAFEMRAWAQGIPRNPVLRTKVGVAIEKGLVFLTKAQKPGGFWSSQDYPGLTGLVVQAFVTAPLGKHKDSATVRDGLKFIRDSAKPDGGIYTKGMGNYRIASSISTPDLSASRFARTNNSTSAFVNFSESRCPCSSRSAIFSASRRAVG